MNGYVLLARKSGRNSLLGCSLLTAFLCEVLVIERIGKLLFLVDASHKFTWRLIGRNISILWSYFNKASCA